MDRATRRWFASGRGSTGGFEVDAHWPRHGLIVELDGYEWHRTRRRFEADRHRDAVLAQLGHRVLRFTWHQVTRQAEMVAAAIGAAGLAPGRRPHRA